MHNYAYLYIRLPSHVSASVLVVCLSSSDDMKFLTFPALLAASFLYVVHGADATLLDWSDPATWPNGKVRNNSSCFYVFEHFIFRFLAETDFQKSWIYNFFLDIRWLSLWMHLISLNKKKNPTVLISKGWSL